MVALNLFGVRKWIAKLRLRRKKERSYLGVFVAVLNVIGLWNDKNCKHGIKSPIGKTITGVWLLAVTPFFVAIFTITVYKSRDGPLIDLLEPALSAGIIVLFAFYACVLRLRGARFVATASTLKRMLASGARLPHQPEVLRARAKRRAERCAVFYVAGAAPFVSSGLAIIVASTFTRTFVLTAWFPYPMMFPFFDVTSIALNGCMVLGYNLVMLVNGLLLLHLVHAVAQLELLSYNLARLHGAGGRKSPCREATLDLRREGRGVVQRRGRAMRGGGGVAGGGGDGQGCRGRVEESRLRVCVRHHQRIIRFVAEFEETFAPVLVNQFNLSVTPMIIGIVFVSNVKELEAKLLLFALPMAANLVNQWVQCWLGEQVTTQSSLVQEAIFASDWLPASHSFKRSMLIVMSRCNQPIVISVAGFIPLSLKSFYAVIKLSYSTYMSLLEMKVIAE